ncbi:MAG: hypothetical protein IH891_10170, partial [Planctomycetes bacterium]|nr:hypothetical protein [Planctomycetota bacterium]
FVKNSLTVSGTVSGTQTVSISQIDVLVDEDFTTTALTVSGGEFIALDADLGARWKLDRIEYFTDDTTASGITMEISDNNLEFVEIYHDGFVNLSEYVIGDMKSNDTLQGIVWYEGNYSLIVEEGFDYQLHRNESGVDIGPRSWSRAVANESLIWRFPSRSSHPRIGIEHTCDGRVAGVLCACATGHARRSHDRIAI